MNAFLEKLAESGPLAVILGFVLIRIERTLAELVKVTTRLVSKDEAKGE